MQVSSERKKKHAELRELLGLEPVSLVIGKLDSDGLNMLCGKMILTRSNSGGRGSQTDWMNEKDS